MRNELPLATDRTALAAVVTAPNAALSLREMPWPELEGSAMIVEVEAATLCGTDVHLWKGAAASEAIPYIPGHETVGVIVQIHGSRHDVLGQEVVVGDRVIWSYPFCGQCFYCTVAAQPTLCQVAVRFGRARADKPPYLLGGCATHHYVPPRSGVVKVPPNVTSPLAASAACALRTVVHGFERLGHVAPHEICVIQGCGPVGLYATAMARSSGFRSVMVMGDPLERLEVARAFGGDAVLSLEDTPSAGERLDWVMGRTGGRGADVVIQCATASAIPEGLSLLRPGGRYLSIGGGGASALELNSASLSGQMLQVIGVRSAEARHFYSALQFLSSKVVPFERMISDVYKLEAVESALRDMASLRQIKPVILPGA